MNTNTKGGERERSDAKIVWKLTLNEGDWGEGEADEGREGDGQAGGGVMRAERRRLAAGGKRSEVKHERIHHGARASSEKTPRG